MAVTCRVLQVSRSGFYEWKNRQPSRRELADRELMLTIRQIHVMSRGTYGAPRVHAELTLDMGLTCGRKRIARLMREDELQGVCHRRKQAHVPAPATHDDLVKREFHADGPDRLWFTDITQHRAADGWGYCCAVMDAWSRRIVGWAIADHIRTELVIDALDMARWQRRPAPGTILHADHGSQYTSWLFGHRLREAGILGSMGRVASSQDNAAMESFWRSCNANSSTAGPGPHASNSPQPCSSGSRAGATPTDATPGSGCSHRTNTKPLPPAPRERHDQTNQNCPEKRVKLPIDASATKPSSPRSHRRRRPTPRREQPTLRNAPRPSDQRQRPHLGPGQQQGPNRNHRRWQGFEPCAWGGRCGVRTRDPFGVNEVRYHCANRPLLVKLCQNQHCLSKPAATSLPSGSVLRSSRGDRQTNFNIAACGDSEDDPRPILRPSPAG